MNGCKIRALSAAYMAAKTKFTNWLPPVRSHLEGRELLTQGVWEWTAQRGRRKCTEDREAQETEWEVEEGGQGRSCDKEVRMKDVASVRPRAK